jgi:cellulose synthase/poly-beta-1,6-N-acetylglucosamine synthase-like glycosyltransferase
MNAWGAWQGGLVVAFWITGLLVLHTYVLYPVTLPLLRRLFSMRPSAKNSEAPRSLKVSLLIAAYNEEKVLEEKIRNSFELEYPRDQFEILIGSDGSSDRTEAIAAKYAPDVKLFAFPQRSGKASVINRLVPSAQGDILIFCDANTLLLKNVVQKMLAHFSNPDVGCVCGRLILHDAGQSALSIGESIYWNLESEIKKQEGQLGIVIGANGGIYAIRKELFQPIPVNCKVMDDFFVTTHVLRAGKAVVYEPQAIGSEETSLDTYGEFHRKVRISQANFNLLPRYIPLLNPLHPLVAYGFFSHKLLRWLAPLFLIALILLNIVLALGSPLYTAILALQALFYAVATFGYFGNGRTRRYKFLLIPFYFVSMNVALLFGLFKALFTRDGGTWNRVERSNVATPGSESLGYPKTSLQAGDYPN